MKRHELTQPIYQENQNVIWGGLKFKIKRISPNEVIYNKNGLGNYLEHLYLLTNEEQVQVWVSEDYLKYLLFLYILY